MLIFAEGGKPENQEKNPRSKDENQQQTQPTHDTKPELVLHPWQYGWGTAGIAGILQVRPWASLVNKKMY